MDILGLLKRLSIRSADDTLIKQTYFCPECCQESPGHEKFCEAGNAIDALEAGRLVVVEKTKCLWAEDIDGNWDTSCGGKFTVTEGCPSENNMKFCTYCSKELSEKMFCFNDETKEQGT